MAKAFFEVFPKIKADRKLTSVFEETEVIRLASNTARTRYKVVMESGHLIHHQYVRKMKGLLASQVFGRPDEDVFIEEHYRLSAQYNPERLLHEYRDSLAEEFSDFSHICGQYFRSAEFICEDTGAIAMKLEDTCFSRDLGEKMADFLTKVFCERCGIKTVFSVSYRTGQNRSDVRGKDPEPMRAGIEAVAREAASSESPATAQEVMPWESASDNGVSNPAGKVSGQTPETRNEDTASKNRKSSKNSYKRSERDDVLFGREIPENAALSRIADIVGEIGPTVVHGKVMGIDRRDIRNNKTIVKFILTDFTDSIYCKVFVPTESAEEFLGVLKEGSFVKVSAVPQMDAFDKQIILSSVSGIMSVPSFVEKRKDNYRTKRVELHCHTKMSDMDGISECKDLVQQAYDWGMPAIAITDHGNLQAFPDANHLREALFGKVNDKRKAEGLQPIDMQDFFKIIYGVECYLVDDLKPIAVLGTGEEVSTSLDSREYVVFDLETTGFNADSDRIIEIGAFRVRTERDEKGVLGGKIIGEFTKLVNPEIPIPYRIQQLTHISDTMVLNEGKIEEILPEFIDFCRGAVLVGHNVSFDVSFVKAKCRNLGLPYDFSSLDTVGIARALLPGHASYRLDAVAKYLGVVLDNHHRGSDDALCTAEIFVKTLPMLDSAGIKDYGGLNALTECNAEVINHLPMYHCIILAKNNIGRNNLYTLVSQSNLIYFNRKPRIPKSLLSSHREGLILGSACVAGELFQAIIDERSDETIAQIASFYDYLEIQPIANNRFLIDAVNRDGNKRYENIKTEEDLQDLNRRVVKLGEQLGKPVCATCDVHFKDPEDQIYRTILQDGIGISDEEPAPLFLRTTDEMLQEFGYLGVEKCEEVVITNTRKIADMIDAISPVRPDKCPPVIPNSDGMLQEICYTKAHQMYGDPLPSIVDERLKKELSSIIKNGYSVMYIIAQKLVWKSNEDGYLVGSRGSVGSSFVATMAGITEVNPLQPHYYCLKCHYSDFDSETVRAYADKCGHDLPSMHCPKCGEWLKKDGFGIQFETFLGFKGDKEPDIDLNFSGEYQTKAHAYTKVIFGHEQTFKAGTIATLADKTAYGYVKGYFERKGEAKRPCEFERLSTGLVGVRRSTGQHPGGIVVLPLGEDINTFTPVQHPANDMTTEIVTTHFDYHSIDHNLLKLDILGHDDPTMIRMLQDLTGIDPLTIPFDDKKVMSLFSGTEALGITPDQIGGVKLGTLGIPEFGTKFVIQMLEDTKPTTFSELVRISGLSHGTDVWLGNAQTLIQEGLATLSTSICCRDDIMAYLISMGVDKSMSFKTMESVRKGKGLKPEMEQAMVDANVPDWYMDSCRKIKYMFPRAHAAAYVMMAWRVAFCKVYYPLAYYCCFFSIRATDFDYKIMARGQETLEQFIADYNARKDSLSQKEEDQLVDMKLVQEFYARGFTFLPIDIQTAQARNFQIIDGKLMPSLTSINGLGEKAAVAVVEAVKDGPFTSKEDFWKRTKVSKTIIDEMDEMGLLGGLPETDQISLFDFI